MVRILLTGASGYVGGRLLKALEASGRQVRCLARRPEFLAPRVASSTEVVKGDVLDPPSLKRAMRDVDVAYYLVHSMALRSGFEEKDRKAAGLFANLAREAGVRKVIYLGGLGKGEDLSEHLASRQEVGRLLRETGVPTTEFRAAIIIGSGSLSFEMIRALVERLPVMITPRWVRMRTQPIAIEDMIAYLVAALDVPGNDSRIFEIGGPDRVSYLEIMKEYAGQRNLRRLMIPVPVLSARLSSLWLGLVTPLYSRVGRRLIDSLLNDTLVTDSSALSIFPFRPRGLRQAIARALVNEENEFAETRWSDALSSVGESPRWGGVRFGTRFVDSKTSRSDLSVSEVFERIERIGGNTGWYYADWLWRIRGLADLILGGAGMRRGRRDPRNLAPGDTVDFWRVEALEPNRLLRLSSEMKLPGRAWLQFEVEGEGSGCTVHQTAIFDPAGLLGLTYWYVLYPIHELIFKNMLAAIARSAARNGSSDASSS